MARHWYFYVSRVLRDMQGGEVLEYAMLAGLFVVAPIAVGGAVGGTVLARWNIVNGAP